MKKSALYHTMPHIRKVRRQMRRTCKMAIHKLGGIHPTLILRDSYDRNILKSHRWRNRIITTKDNLCTTD